MNKEIPAILGGNKLRTKCLTSRVTMGNAEKKAAIDIINSDVLSAFIGGPGKHFLGGEKVLEFENAWAKKYGFKHAISVNSWTTGLMVAVGACGIEPGDEVICSPFTMSASATSVLFYGGIPVFADINNDNFCLDPKSIEEKITKRTKAILVVHIFGGPADMDAIMKIAKKHNLKVIEDGAQSPGVFYKGKPVGAIGDIGGFSLNFHKHIHTGEGGMLVTNDDDIAFKAQLIRNHGENYADQLPKDQLSNVIGSNYRLTEIQSAIGIEQLKKLPTIIEHRNKLAHYLTEELKQFPFLILADVQEKNSNHAYYMFPIRFNAEKAGITRNLFVKAVNAEFPIAKGYESVPLTEGYVKPLYLNPIYQEQIAIGSKGFPFNYNEGIEYNYDKGICPNAEKLHYEEFIASAIVREPLSIDDMKDFISAIRKVYDNATDIMSAFPDNDNLEIYSPINAATEAKVR